MPRRGKTLQIAQVEAMQRKAVQFASDVLNDPDKADEIESLTPEEYAQRKGIRIVVNPKPKSRNKETRPMAGAKGPSKAELEDLLDEASAKVQEMLDAELTRKELVVLAKDLDELLNGPDAEDDDDETEEETDDDDDE